jgi:hypothetical protein
MARSNAARAFARVRGELVELGIFKLGFLDGVKLKILCLNRWCLLARGFFYDSGVPWSHKLLGMRAGVIYLSSDMPRDPALLSVIRHEFAHAWAWENKKFMSRPWFKEAFGTPYFSNKKHQNKVKYCPLTYASKYATTSSAEDFAETFENYLKYRRSLVRFKHRPGFYKKLKAVKAAVRQQAAQLK